LIKIGKEIGFNRSAVDRLDFEAIQFFNEILHVKMEQALFNIFLKRANGNPRFSFIFICHATYFCYTLNDSQITTTKKYECKTYFIIRNLLHILGNPFDFVDII